MRPGAICARHRDLSRLVDVLRAHQVPKECLPEVRPSQAKLDELAQRALQQLPLFPAAEAMAIVSLSVARPTVTSGRPTETPLWGEGEADVQYDPPVGKPILVSIK